MTESKETEVPLRGTLDGISRLGEGTCSEVRMMGLRKLGTIAEIGVEIGTRDYEMVVQGSNRPWLGYLMVFEA